LILDTNPPISLVREIFIEYSKTPGVNLHLKKFDHELQTLPDPYLWLVVAMDEDHAAGCAALRPLDPVFAELKRLYVRPAYRGTGLGRRLAQAAIDAARGLGFQGVRLDTVTTMDSAIALYGSLGFREIPCYGQKPEDGLLYFELRY
jgi:putative acetyltransferase